MDIVRNTIITCLTGFKDVVFDGNTVAQLEAKVRGYKKAANTYGLAYTIARNWALDQRRAARNYLRLANERAEREHAAKEREEKFLAAKSEYWHTVLRAMEDISLPRRATARNHFQILWLTTFEKRSDAELALTYPQTTRNGRDQWRRRARNSIRPFASKCLWSNLSKWMKKP